MIILTFGSICVSLLIPDKNNHIFEFSMARIKVKNREFELSITESFIEETVQKIATKINRDYEGKNPLLLSILNGSFVFAADLVRKITIPCQISL